MTLSALKSYAAPWEGRLVLACRKCQKKLKDDGDLAPLAKLRKTVKAHNKQHPHQPLHVLNVPCMDLCPKRAVTLCVPAQSADRLLILRSVDELESLYTAL